MIAAVAAGFLAGSIPTAEWLARQCGVDLRTDGSGNPGANNARRLGGWKLAALVLGVEMAKSAALVIVVRLFVSDPASVAAGIGAVAGNVYNPWHRFRGGQGLGAAAGVLLAAWPIGLMIGVVVIALTTKMAGSSYPATTVAMAALMGAAALAPSLWLPWGIGEAWPALTAGLFVLIVPKQIALIRRSAHSGSQG